MTPHQAATSKVSLRRALKPRYINLSITTLDFFSLRWIAKKEHVYSGASQKKSKHHSNINYKQRNSSGFLSERKRKVSEITLKQLVEWIEFFSGGGGRGFPIEWVILTPFSLFDSFFKALGVGQVKDVKQRWYLITILNVFAII